MTDASYTLHLDEAGLERLASLVAIELRSGDLVALGGDLGAGKTTFARAAIRTLLDDSLAEVPSPTFAIVQHYETPRGFITHCDLYRIDGESGAAELGLEEALARGAVMVEWPERAQSLVADERLDVMLSEVDGGNARQVSLTGHGRWQPRIVRLLAIHAFLDEHGWGAADIRAIPGDASSRRYFRLSMGERRALLMDAPRQPDGPPIRDGLAYSRIAHLAEDVRPFVAIARHLRSIGLAAPGIMAADLDAGLLLLEDLGDGVFGVEFAAGASQRDLWRDGVDALLELHRVPAPTTLPIGGGELHTVPPFDRRAMQIEVELLPDWYVPAATGAPLAENARNAFIDEWQRVFARLAAVPSTLLLRDYHSPNLLRLPGRAGAAAVGIIDFQDAMLGPAAYDLVSLLQDARLDVPAAIEAELFAHYCTEAERTQPGFERAAFEAAYRVLGAQRNTKILGIFARLAKRDGKPRYLQHIPRIWRYLERDLAHPELHSLKAWYDMHLPPTIRGKAIAA
jgi:tRNA threonylcarbamoyl adenosine modification protein YjeE